MTFHGWDQGFQFSLIICLGDRNRNLDNIMAVLLIHNGSFPEHLGEANWLTHVHLKTALNWRLRCDTVV